MNNQLDYQVGFILEILKIGIIYFFLILIALSFLIMEPLYMNTKKSQAKYIKKSACLFGRIWYNGSTPLLRAAFGRQQKKDKPLGLAFLSDIC